MSTSWKAYIIVGGQAAPLTMTRFNVVSCPGGAQVVDHTDPQCRHVLDIDSAMRWR